MSGSLDLVSIINPPLAFIGPPWTSNLALGLVVPIPRTLSTRPSFSKTYVIDDDPTPIWKSLSGIEVKIPTCSSELSAIIISPISPTSNLFLTVRLSTYS